MCGGGGGIGGIAGALIGGAVGYLGGGATGALSGMAAGAGVGGAVGNALSPENLPEIKMPSIDLKGPASSNMGTGETGALVELGSDTVKAGRLSKTGTGSQSGGSKVSGLGSGGLRI